MALRKVIFWLHLVAGLVAGLVIGIMSFTGVALAYEKEIVAWAERGAQRVEVPAAGTPRLPLEELMRRVRESRPDFQPVSVVVKSDPGAAVGFSLGRAGAVYADPYTGEVRTPEPTAWRGFMSAMVSWHRYVALSGDSRATGKAITGACNAAFLVLGLTGIYLWWPRLWSFAALKGVAYFNFKFRGKARDWSWHNVIGIWSVVPIVVMTATALPISYRWAGDLLNQLNGPAATPAPGPGAEAAVALPAPSEGARPLGHEALLASVQQQLPGWKQITLNLGGGPGAGPGGPPRAEGQAAAPAPGGGSGREGGPAAGSRSEGPARGGNGLRPVAFSVREADSWPRTATTTLALNPYTGEVLRREGYADLPLGRQIRSWTRFLHTGEALGPIGQAVAGLGSLGGVFLMWTGFALSWRRFFGRNRRPDAAGLPDRPRTATVS